MANIPLPVPDINNPGVIDHFTADYINTFAPINAALTTLSDKVDLLPTRVQFDQLSAKVDNLPTRVQFDQLLASIAILKAKVNGLATSAQAKCKVDEPRNLGGNRSGL